MEGFLGAVSTVGIESVVIQVYDSSTGNLANMFFEVDHVQVNAIPEPASLIVWSLLIGLTCAGGTWRFFSRRRGQ